MKSNDIIILVSRIERESTLKETKIRGGLPPQSHKSDNFTTKRSSSRVLGLRGTNTRHFKDLSEGEIFIRIDFFGGKFSRKVC